MGGNKPFQYKNIKKRPSKVKKIRKISENNEDSEIKKLSKKLCIKGSKKIPSIFYEEGLGDLIDICDAVDGELSDDSCNENSTANFDESQSSESDDSNISDAGTKCDFEKIAMTHKSIPIKKKEPTKQVEQGENNRDEKLAILTKAIKVLLNKVTESNMASIVDSFKEILSQNGFYDTSAQYCKVFMEFVVQPNQLPDRYLLVHSTFCSIIHAYSGNEFIYIFLKNTVAKFIESYDLLCTDSSQKYCHNIAVSLSNLYFLNSIGIKLILSIINKCIERFLETDIEMLLIFAKYCGFHIRKNNPLVLKEIIQRVHDKTKTLDFVTKRTSFMIENLTSIQHNNPSKVVGYDPALFQTFYKVHKVLTKNFNEGTQVDVLLNEILDYSESSKWKHGENSLIDPCSITESEKMTPHFQQPNSSLVWDEKLLEAAKNQNYKTKTKINIFCTLMSSNGCKDAQIRLNNLNLRGKENEEIIRISVSCCLQESEYNSFYSELVSLYTSTHRSFKSTTQYCLWDLIRKIDNLTRFSASNLAQLMADLFSKGCLKLSVFKIVNFDKLSPKEVKFYKTMLLNLFKVTSSGALKQLFSIPTSNQKLEALGETVLYFLLSHLLESDKNDDIQRKLKLARCFLKGLNPNLHDF